MFEQLSIYTTKTTGVGVTRFSGIACFPMLTGMGGASLGLHLVGGQVINGWDMTGVPNVPVTLDFTGPNYGTDGNGAYQAAVDPYMYMYGRNNPVYVFAMVPTNHFTTDQEKAADQTSTYYFPFMSEPFTLGPGITPAPPIIIRAVF
ncbi:MAG: hypothetical protein R6V10_11715 [bacterium]